MNEKGFLNRHKSYVLHQGEGPIRNIKWQADYIAWANDYVSLQIVDVLILEMK